MKMTFLNFRDIVDGRMDYMHFQNPLPLYLSEVPVIVD